MPLDQVLAMLLIMVVVGLWWLVDGEGLGIKWRERGQNVRFFDYQIGRDEGRREVILNTKLQLWPLVILVLIALQVSAIWLPSMEIVAQNDPGKIVTALAWSPNGTQIATGSAIGTVHVWNAATGAIMHTLTGHQNHLTGVAGTPMATDC